MSRSHLVARNVTATLITQMISWGLTLFVTLYLPRYLGAAGLGILTLASSFGGIFSLMVSLGTSTALIKEIARDHNRVGELVLAALVSRLPLGILAIGLGWATAHLLRYNPTLCLLIVTVLVTMIFGQLNDVLGSALRGLEEIPRQNAAALAEKITLAVLTVLLVLHHAPLWTFVAISIVGTAVSFSINVTVFRPYLATLRPPQWSTICLLTKDGLPYLTTAVFVCIYGNCDALLLSKLASVEAIGWYGLAKRLGGTTLMLPAVLTSAMLPTLCRIFWEDRTAFDLAIRRLFNFMFICVVPFAAVLILAPGRLIILLHYPVSFQHSIPVMIMMGWTVVLWYLSQVAATALVACDRQAALSRITGISALICIPVCGSSIYVTQHFFGNGAIGAMLSDVIVEVYMLGAYIRALPAGLFNWKNIGVLGRAMAAALPLLGLFYFVHTRIGLLLLLPGALVYLPLCARLGCLHPRDVSMVRDIISQKLNRSKAVA